MRAVLPQFTTVIEEALRQSGVPGAAVAVVYRDEVVYLRGFGVRKAGEDAEVDPDTVFQIASLSKPMAATVLAGLVGARKIGWDDPIIRYLPEFRLPEPWVTQEVTIRDLLCHRSGLADHAGDDLEDLGYTRKEVLARLRFLKPASSFRSHYAYTNFGFTAAGEAGARAAGKPWEELADDILFRPLGMWDPLESTCRHASLSIL